jgi:hypothetical protein
MVLVCPLIVKPFIISSYVIVISAGCNPFTISIEVATFVSNLPIAVLYSS